MARLRFRLWLLAGARGEYVNGRCCGGPAKPMNQSSTTALPPVTSAQYAAIVRVQVGGSRRAS
jgi:hypothetical protein